MHEVAIYRILLLGMKLKQTIIAGLTVFALAVGVIAVKPPLVSADCGGAKTSIINCTQGKNPKTAQDSGVWGLLMLALNIMTAGVGIAAVGGIVYGSLMYASARDSAEQAKKAIGIITNVVIGIVAYGLMFLILNFLIPGGIFS